jgi:hypothetical protein
MIVGFKSGEDTLKLNGFGNLNYADLEPHFRSDQEAVSISLDLDAATGGQSQNLLFTDTFGIGEADIVFVNDRLDGGNPEGPAGSRGTSLSHLPPRTVRPNRCGGSEASLIGV